MSDKKPKASDDFSAFDRFQALAKRIISTPKAEIDRQLAEYEAKKKRRRKRS